MRMVAVLSLCAMRYCRVAVRTLLLGHCHGIIQDGALQGVKVECL